MNASAVRAYQNHADCNTEENVCYDVFGRSEQIHGPEGIYQEIGETGK